ncbi:MAG: ThiF family adenylyltransferase [Anaeromyxobacteraceae bacterium]
MAGPSGRYSRQELFAPVGREGQARLRAARVLVVGCGGLGSNAANLLARAGVGTLRIVDRDVVELSNLQRQSLFCEADAREPLPKAVAAARAIAAFNSDVTVEPFVADLDATNVLRFLDGMDLVVDGFDNFEGRYVLNDACAKRGVPWIYGACVASTAMAQLVVPGATPCLRCGQRDAPEPGTVQTCDTSGIIGPAATLAASLQVALALRWLVERTPPARPFVMAADAWELEVQRLALPPRDPECPTCAHGRYDFLEGEGLGSTSLCGNAVQVRPHAPHRPDFEAIAARVRAVGEVHVNPYLLRLRAPPYELTLFDDGRAIVKGTVDPAVARGLLARWIGA